MYRDVFPAFKPSSTKALVHGDRLSDETVHMSNMSPARSVNINWTAVGGGKTICRYQILNSYPLSVANLVNITGRLADGSTLLNVVLNREKIRVISEEVQRILKEVEK